MKTWLTCDENGWVFRDNEYGDEPLWIGCIEISHCTKYFQTYGDNRVFTPNELKQLLDFLNDYQTI